MKPEPRGRDFRIGDVLHDAWAFDPKLWRGGRMGVAEDFSPAVALLLELLAERRVEYALAGGMAMLKVLEGRNTKPPIVNEVVVIRPVGDDVPPVGLE